MAYQYIHTSAKRGLEPGKSGFCCVARDRDTPPDLILELERLSHYETAQGAISPIILRFSHIETRSGAYNIISRIQDAGVDYSKRNNHISHHLVFSKSEIARLPDPATILLCWTGWKDSWDSPPRILGDSDKFEIQKLDTHFATTHKPEEFPSLEPHNALISRSLILAPGEEIAAVSWFRQQLQRLPNHLRWDFPFTSFLLSSDNPTDFAWSCSWSDRELPYELDLVGKPWRIQRPSEKKEEIVAEPESSTPSPTDPEKEPSALKKRFKAPRVEIPKEIDRSKFKRPKAKWTSNRFNKTINTTILLIAITCVAITAYFIKSIKESDLETPQLPFGNSTSTTEPETTAVHEGSQSLQALESEWQRLLEKQLLTSDKEHATDIANQLYTHGIKTPLSSLEFLEKFAKPNTTTTVPDFALGGQFEDITLTPNLAHYLSERSHHLLPKSLHEALQKIIAIQPNLNNLYQGAPANHFRSGDMSIRLRETRRSVHDQLTPTQTEARIATQDFEDLLKQTNTNTKLQAYLHLQSSFDYPDSQGFLAFGPHEKITNPEFPKYQDYAISLFQNFVLPRYSYFIPNPSFSAALKQLDSPNASYDVVYEVMLNAQTSEAQFTETWNRIVSTWHKAFIRSDLMEETLVAYAIEQLEENKKQLIALQSQFSENDLTRYRTLQTLAPLFDQAIQLSDAASLSEEWIVISTEHTQRPESH